MFQKVGWDLTTCTDEEYTDDQGVITCTDEGYNAILQSEIQNYRVQMKGITLLYSQIQNYRVQILVWPVQYILSHWLRWMPFLRSNIQYAAWFLKLRRLAVQLEPSKSRFCIAAHWLYMCIAAVHILWVVMYMREEFRLFCFWICLGLVAKQPTGCTASCRKR